MSNIETKENTLLTARHMLLHDGCPLDPASSYQGEVDYIKKNFCGNVFSGAEGFNSFNAFEHSQSSIGYLCGDISAILRLIDLSKLKMIKIIKELSHNYQDLDLGRNRGQLITLGEVPINMYNVGVYFRKFFHSSKDYYTSIVDEHQFQSLTESNKSGQAFRKGIYLTKVEAETEDQEIKFKLLRCSTNLDGPTDNLRDTDNEIIDKVNDVTQLFFNEKAELNHVLAQTYHNKVESNGSKLVERKAKIKTHSDKTKDMPGNALMAFCSFYKDYSNGGFTDERLKDVKKSGDSDSGDSDSGDSYDYRYKGNISVLTKLRFKLKSQVTDESLEKQFDVVLYPNSVFLISLSTNRLYTHEIKPSGLPVDKIPTRMGYVIRCSNTNAIFKNNQTYIIKDGKYIKLEEATQEGISELKKLYYKENSTIEKVKYDKFYFSLNNGDYTKPMV